LAESPPEEKSKENKETDETSSEQDSQETVELDSEQERCVQFRRNNEEASTKVQKRMQRSATSYSHYNISDVQNKEDANFANKNLESTIKMTEGEVSTMLKNLNEIVTKKQMYILWFNVHNSCVRRYYNMMDGLWKNIKVLGSNHNIAIKDLLKGWWKAYPSLISELRKNDHYCICDFYNLFEKGECTQDVYKKFIDNINKNWEYSTNAMKSKWHDFLMNELKAYTN
ncbi:RAD protein, partial [Plasmodium ovale curtisi]